ncbi:Endonuclease/exonuclease/phosphatase [Armillaria borealis]|uniref:Endonuclease/exonuclease/phosphatase n=1 Tax=Armillaria borealis TaxID=47425 RepID=A0AA39MG74_9AGAR|nr:Endonuclease/exonuclease/phosphatase [Armillaria borealis]
MTSTTTSKHDIISPAPATTQAGRGWQPPSEGGDLSPPDGGSESAKNPVETPGHGTLNLGTAGDSVRLPQQERVLRGGDVHYENEPDIPHNDTPDTQAHRNRNTECNHKMSRDTCNAAEDAELHSETPVRLPQINNQCLQWRQSLENPPSPQQQDHDERMDDMRRALSQGNDDTPPCRNPQESGGSQVVEKSKWSDLNLMMKERWISILTLQETHLSDDYAKTVQTLYGIAIVLNKELIKTEDVMTTELIPGRALLIQAPWHAGKTFTWLAIYAPNKERENKEMWESLSRMWMELKLPAPDGMSGDFNFVKDSIDRLPVHDDSKATVEAFRTFHSKLKLRDGWREANEGARDFTFTQMSGKFSRSRIDRIYVSSALLQNCNEWEIWNPPIGTDH